MKITLADAGKKTPFKEDWVNLSRGETRGGEWKLLLHVKEGSSHAGSSHSGSKDTDSKPVSDLLARVSASPGWLRRRLGRAPASTPEWAPVKPGDNALSVRIPEWSLATVTVAVKRTGEEAPDQTAKIRVAPAFFRWGVHGMLVLLTGLAVARGWALLWDDIYVGGSDAWKTLVVIATAVAPTVGGIGGSTVIDLLSNWTRRLKSAVTSKDSSHLLLEHPVLITSALVLVTTIVPGLFVRVYNRTDGKPAMLGYEKPLASNPNQNGANALLWSPFSPPILDRSSSGRFEICSGAPGSQGDDSERSSGVELERRGTLTRIRNVLNPRPLQVRCGDACWQGFALARDGACNLEEGQTLRPADSGPECARTGQTDAEPSELPHCGPDGIPRPCCPAAVTPVATAAQGSNNRSSLPDCAPGAGPFGARQELWSPCNFSGKSFGGSLKLDRDEAVLKCQVPASERFALYPVQVLKGSVAAISIECRKDIDKYDLVSHLLLRAGENGGPIPALPVCLPRDGVDCRLVANVGEGALIGLAGELLESRRIAFESTECSIGYEAKKNGDALVGALSITGPTSTDIRIRSGTCTTRATRRARDMQVILTGSEPRPEKTDTGSAAPSPRCGAIEVTAEDAPIGTTIATELLGYCGTRIVTIKRNTATEMEITCPAGADRLFLAKVNDLPIDATIELVGQTDSTSTTVGKVRKPKSAGSRERSAWVCIKHEDKSFEAPRDTQCSKDRTGTTPKDRYRSSSDDVWIDAEGRVVGLCTPPVPMCCHICKQYRANPKDGDPKPAKCNPRIEQFQVADSPAACEGRPLQATKECP